MVSPVENTNGLWTAKGTGWNTYLSTVPGFLMILLGCALYAPMFFL